jgi:exodeoxyribonuclease VII small subunit
LAAKKKTQTFGAARRRLDEILDELEQDAGDVDQLGERVKEASELIRFCRERLAAARREVTEVVAALAQSADGEGAAEAEKAEKAEEGEEPEGEDAGSSDLPF